MVEGVNNNNSNAGLYAASGVVLGGGAGAATAYLTKPYLKDGAPTDEFVKKAGDKLIDQADVSKEQKTIIKEVTPMLDKLAKASDAESYKNLTASMVDKLVSIYPDVDTLKSEIKKGSGFASLFVPSSEAEGYAKLIENIEKASTMDELKQLFVERSNAELEAKGFETCKKELSDMLRAVKEAGIPMSVDDFGKMTINKVLDDGKLVNKIVDGEKALTDEGFSIIKKAAKSIQGKYAMIYGAIGAAVLGVVGYVAGVMGGNKAEEAVEQPASVNTQA